MSARSCREPAGFAQDSRTFIRRTDFSRIDTRRLYQASPERIERLERERAFQALEQTKKNGAAEAKESAEVRKLKESIRKLVRSLPGTLFKDRSPFESALEAAADKAQVRIPAPVKRIVPRRDSDQCTFVDDKGRRCTERRGLEFHHRNPYGMGGDRSPENICLMCCAHNAYLAEIDYGKELMRTYRKRAGRVSETGPRYFATCSVASVGVLESMRTRDA